MAPKFLDRLSTDMSLPAPKPVFVQGFSGLFSFHLQPRSLRVSFKRSASEHDLFAAELRLSEWANVVEQLDAQIMAAKLGLFRNMGSDHG